MKKLIGLMAVVSLVACSESTDPATAASNFGAAANQGTNQGTDQGSGTQNQNPCTTDAQGAALVFDAATNLCFNQVTRKYYNPTTGFYVDPATGIPLQSSSSVAQVPMSETVIDPYAGVSSSSVAPIGPASSSAVAPASSSSQTVAPKSSAATVVKSSSSVAVDDGKFKLELWDGAAGEAQVQTGNKTGGWWYSYGNDGSEITWGAEVGDEYDAGSMAPVVAACSGVCGDYVIGGTDEYPYLGFGFGYAKANTTTGDATAIKGICVTYTYSGDATFAIELGLTTAQENKLGSALPMVELPAGTKKTLDFSWSDFVQPTWATTTMTGANAAKQLSSIKFKFADPKAGDTGSFAVYKIGPQGSCN